MPHPFGRTPVPGDQGQMPPQRREVVEDVTPEAAPVVEAAPEPEVVKEDAPAEAPQTAPAKPKSTPKK